MKYNVAFDGILPCELDVFTLSKYANENSALPEVIRNHVKQDNNHSNIYIVDRGLQSTVTMKNFTEESIVFIIRASENRRHLELKFLINEDTEHDLGLSTLVKDSEVY